MTDDTLLKFTLLATPPGIHTPHAYIQLKRVSTFHTMYSLEVQLVVYGIIGSYIPVIYLAGGTWYVFISYL